MAALDEEMGRTTIGADEGTSRKRRRTEDDAISSTGSDSEDVADIGDEVAQAENLMDTGPSGVGRDDQDTRYLFDDTSLLDVVFMYWCVSVSNFSKYCVVVCIIG
ncbi:hypothetical protein LINPERPRIM_LOCUS912, partial [Linum perenne]